MVTENVAVDVFGIIVGPIMGDVSFFYLSVVNGHGAKIKV